MPLSFNVSHTTDQCQVFRGFLTRQLNLKRLVVSDMEQHAMKLEEYKANITKAKVSAKSSPTPNPVMHEERDKTYKQAVQKFPLETRAIEG